MTGPPANHADIPYFECTSSRLVPVLDTLFTGLQAVNLGVLLATSDEKWEEAFEGDAPIGRAPAIGMYSVLVALGAASMYYGFTRTSRCAEAKAEMMRRMMDREPWPPL